MNFLKIVSEISQPRAFYHGAEDAEAAEFKNKRFVIEFQKTGSAASVPSLYSAVKSHRCFFFFTVFE